MPLSEGVLAWWAYERPAAFEVLRSDVSVPLRDGVELACSLSRPAMGATAVPGMFPGLLVEYTPYALIIDIMISEAEFFAKRGYNALVCQVRGTGVSGGTWNHAGAKQDGVDAYDLIEWLAMQPFSDGRMGQFGGSYGGFTSYQAAAERPPHLLATAPMIAPGSLYHDVIYPGGIKTTEHGNIDAWPDSAETLSLGRISADAEYAMNRMHPTFDAYWEERSMHERVASIQVPILTIGAWEDPNFRSGTLADIEAGLDKTWAIYGQWPHRSPVALEANCDSCVPDPLPSGVLLAWFDHWVKQIPDVPLPMKPVFVSQEGPRGVGQGFRELTWNPERSTQPTYQLGSDSTLALTAAASDTLTFHEPAAPNTSGGSVTFTSAPLSEDHVLAGHPALKLTATLSAADANFYVELLDVDTEGEETLVNDGFLKASHRNSDVAPEPVMPGVAIEYTIAIRPDHHRFVAGNSVRIRISGGDSMSLVQPAEPVDVTLQTGSASALHMPLGW
jgi:predicted acyl esterase